MNENDVPTDSLDDDLHWLAFCYAQGELDGEAESRFEARLLEDEQARQALVRAVELVDAIAACAAITTPSGQGVGQRPRRALAAGVLAGFSLAAALFLALWLNRATEPAAPPPAAVAQRPLALAWTEVRQQGLGSWEPSLSDDYHDADPNHDWTLLSDVSWVEPSLLLDEPGPAPDWMLAAVAAASNPSRAASPADPDDAPEEGQP